MNRWDCRQRHGPFVPNLPTKNVYNTYKYCVNVLTLFFSSDYFTFVESLHLQKCASIGDLGWTSTGFINGKKSGHLQYINHGKSESNVLKVWILPEQRGSTLIILPAEQIWCCCCRLDANMDIFIENSFKIAGKS